MSAKEEAALDERLERRRQRRFRNRRLVEKNSFDKPENAPVKPNPTTQSLDRKSSQRVISATSKPEEFSSTTALQNSVLSPVERSSSKQPSISSAQQTPPIQQVPIDEKTNSAPTSATTETFPLSNEKRPVTAKEDPPVTLLAITPAEKSAPIADEKRVASHESATLIASSLVITTSERSISSTSEKSVVSQKPGTPTTSPTILPAIASSQKSHPSPSEKSIVSQKPATPTTSPKALPQITPSEKSSPNISDKPTVSQGPVVPIVSPTTVPTTIPPEKSSSSATSEKPRISPKSSAPIARPVTLEKSPSIPQEIRGYSTPNHSNKSEFHPSTIHPQPTHSNGSLFQAKPRARSTSEQVVPKIKFKHQPIDSTIAKQNCLALPYLFSKRIVKTQVPHTVSLGSPQPYRKSVWD